jgi:hypothetical protein
MPADRLHDPLHALSLFWATEAKVIKLQILYIRGNQSNQRKTAE